ncbi:T9SS type A sorting domain-containing protein [Aurantibacillus circumpalustris]|uniref:T9SS type A sorting domain-containing protein n=1 Tax=Aurantibacillus circumpalustris TaxID=3036359 RepID=UPI00295BF294|nr:T9SS type A sorting domain-containing protein [Aurantibacillus circumpalustris]
MKKNYQSIKLMIACLILFGLKAGAQLSGIVTINNTIPSSATNFTSFTAFAAVVNTAGVSGPLTVNVAATSNLYTEQVSFSQAPGISATNTITINGNGRTITFNATAAANPHTIVLNGADYMFFNNLNIIGTGASYALVVHLWNQANNNEFLNCAITAPLNAASTTQIPFSLSNSGTVYSTSGNSGNNNVVNTCTLSGGYFSVCYYGNTVAPFTVGNKVLNSKIQDFYIYGVYNYYGQYLTIKGNIIERPFRTTLSSCYSIYLSTSSIDILVEGNHIRNPYLTGITNANLAYGVYVGSGGTSGHENIIRNNVISDMYCNGTVYGIYVAGVAYTLVYHNTIILDGATNTAGTTYGIYSTVASSPVKNNIIIINRAGNGTKYCLYAGTAANTWNSNHNVFNMLSTAGTNGLVFASVNYTSLATWQAISLNDKGSTTADPLFNNPGAWDFAPTATVVNNMCPPLGVTTDFSLTTRSVLFPDPGAVEVFNTPCTGAPGPNSFVTPTVAFCPGMMLDLTLLNSGTYTNSGYTIAWQTSTASAVGPFASVPGATLNSYNTGPINQTIHYRAVITCAAGSSFSTVPQSVNVAPVTTSVVPYHEGLETLALNKLPNCSWAASNVGISNLTYTAPAGNNRVPHAGSQFASFYSSPSGTSYFYTNGIQLVAGITYSASMWYITESGFNNWADLSIMVGGGQTPAGMVTVASTGGTVTPILYTPLSNTFVVPLSGLYYVAVKATSGAGVAPYLTWDDLRITIPCEINGPNLSISPSATTICQGQSVLLTGVGADSYLWSDGQITTVGVFAPTFPQTYTLTGFNTLSGCTTTLTQMVDVLQSPQVTAFVNGPTGCAGKAVNVVAQGADSYFWNTGAQVASTFVYPNATTTYSVIGTNSLGCTSIAILQVSVSPAPNITVLVSSTQLCNGDQLTLTGSGAGTYNWLTSLNSSQSGNPLTVNPNASATYTVIGKDNIGCEGKATVSFAVEECTSLTKLSSSNVSKLYPNPTTGVFAIELNKPASKIEISDLTGRVISSYLNVEGKVSFNINTLANGIYYVKISQSDSYEVVKLVKSNN